VLLAASSVSVEAGLSGLRRSPRVSVLYPRVIPVLMRVTGGKSRAQMTVSELEAAIGWLERNRLCEHLELLEGDPRYAWSARKRGVWKPPVGRIVARSG
jgi:hypothetical protein